MRQVLIFIVTMPRGGVNVLCGFSGPPAGPALEEVGMQTLKTKKGTIRSIHPATGIGSVSLTVSDLESQVAFYRTLLGFSVHWRRDGRAGLGAGGDDLVELVERVGAKRYPRTTGLYH